MKIEIDEPSSDGIGSLYVDSDGDFYVSTCEGYFEVGGASSYDDDCNLTPLVPGTVVTITVP